MKNKIKPIFVIIFITCIGVLISYKVHFKEKPSTKSDQFMLLSITKSGTHLALNLLNKMTGYQSNDHGLEDLGDTDQFDWYHTHLSPNEVKKILRKNKNIKKYCLLEI